MRVVATLLGLLALAGCDGPGGAPNKNEKMGGDAVAALTAAGGAFDYRYAYKLPGAHVKPVVESHAAGCDRLGPAKCRILAMRYRVDDGNHITATLTFRIDPAVARAFGEAATKVVAGKAGALVENEIAGADATASARSNALIGRLREQLANARAEPNDPAQRARAQRLQIALDMIGEVEAGQGGTMATAPVLITYTSGTPAPGLSGSTEVNFKDAGNKLIASSAGLAQVLAGIAPFVLLMIVGVVALRFLVHGRDGETADARSGDHDPYRDPEIDEGENRNMIQRWFNRDEKE